MYNIDVGGDERRVEELEGLEGGGKLSSIDLKAGEVVANLYAVFIIGHLVN